MEDVLPVPPKTNAGMDRPSRSPSELADLISFLPHQQKAEIMYELVLYAAIAAEETGHASLNELLAELEDLAAVQTNPERQRELRKTLREAPHKPQPSSRTV